MQQVRSNYAYWKQQEVVVETQKLADDRQQQQPDDDDTSWDQPTPIDGGRRVCVWEQFTVDITIAWTKLVLQEKMDS